MLLKINKSLVSFRYLHISKTVSEEYNNVKIALLNQLGFVFFTFYTSQKDVKPK